MTEDASAPQPPAYEPERQYQVVLKRPVIILGVRFLPRDKHVMRGDFLNLAIAENGADAIASAIAL